MFYDYKVYEFLFFGDLQFLGDKFVFRLYMFYRNTDISMIRFVISALTCKVTGSVKFCKTW